MTPHAHAGLFRRIGSLVLMVFLLSALEAAGTLAALRRQEADSRVVNLAGRQRMLTQAMARDALQIGAGASARVTHLRDARELFERTLRALGDGDPERAIPPASPAAATALKALDAEWRPLSDALGWVFDHGPAAPGVPERLGTVLARVDGVLARADEVTTVFDREAREKNRWLRGFVIGSLALAVLVFGLTLLEVRRIVGPLRAVAAAARGIAGGAEAAGLEVPERSGEVSDVARAIRDLGATLARQKRRQAAQHSATRVLADATSLAEAMPAVLKGICESLGWQWAAMWTIDRDAAVLRCGEMWQAGEAQMAEFSACSQAITFAEGTGLPGRVWSSGKPAWIRDVQVDPNFPRAKVARQVGLHGALCFPIRSALGILGVMEFLSVSVSDPDDDLLAMMDAVGSQLGQFIERRLAQEQSAQKALELGEAHQRLERDFAERTESGRRLAAQHAATRVLAEAADFAEAAPRVLRAVCESLDWQCSAMWTVDATANLLRRETAWPIDDPVCGEFEALSREMTFAPGRGLPGRVWATGNSAWITDVTIDPNFPRARVAAKVGLHGAFAFPIRLEGRVLAVMEFFSPTSRLPDEALLAMMAAIGSQVGQFIERKRAERAEKEYVREVEREKERSNELLHVILPADIVKELHATNEVRSRRHERVAVLFCDIVGFTRYCDGREPQEIVSKLQLLVERYERLAEDHRLLKIKTIGDCFMAVCGLLEDVDNPTLHALRCGLAMNEVVRGICEEWSVRVGIHVGPVVAGVLGRKQYQYDLWGDTVNTASRMESNGVPASVVLSELAYREVAALCECESLGRIKVKGKGEQEIFRFARWRDPPIEASSAA